MKFDDSHLDQSVSGLRIAVVCSRFNSGVTEQLLQGALRALSKAGVRKEDITIVHVPGAFEIPLIAKRLAETLHPDAIVCLGCLIKGETMHFEYISSVTFQGIQEASLATGVPMALGVLTTLTEEQALMRAGEGRDNKGWEAARAAIEMTSLLKDLPLK